jgi:hypothetical protein
MLLAGPVGVAGAQLHPEPWRRAMRGGLGASAQAYLLLTPAEQTERDSQRVANDSTLVSS